MVEFTRNFSYQKAVLARSILTFLPQDNPQIHFDNSQESSQAEHRETQPYINIYATTCHHVLTVTSDDETTVDVHHIKKHPEESTLPETVRASRIVVNRSTRTW